MRVEMVTIEPQEFTAMRASHSPRPQGVLHEVGKAFLVTGTIAR